MKPVFERENLTLTVFNVLDVIASSGEETPTPTEPVSEILSVAENAFGAFGTFDQAPGSWFS